MNRKTLNPSKKNSFFRKWSLFLGAMWVAGMSTNSHAFFVDVDGVQVQGEITSNYSRTLKHDNLHFKDLQIALNGMQNKPIRFIYSKLASAKVAGLDRLCQLLTGDPGSVWGWDDSNYVTEPGVFIPGDKNEPLQYMDISSSSDYKSIKNITCW